MLITSLCSTNHGMVPVVSMPIIIGTCHMPLPYIIHHTFPIIGISYIPINSFLRTLQVSQAKRLKAMVSELIEKNREVRQNGTENPHLLRELAIQRAHPKAF